MACKTKVATVSLFSFSYRCLRRRHKCIFKPMIRLLPRYRFYSQGSGDIDPNHANNTTFEGRKLNLVVSSLRLDRVVASAFGLGRSKVSNFIASGDVFVNKANTRKAALLINEGDEVDLLREKTISHVRLSRFTVTAISKDMTKKNKRLISVARHGHVAVSKKDFGEKYTHSDVCGVSKTH